MQRIYSNRAATPVHNIKNVLTSYGIKTIVKGESLAGAGVGELPVWVELWLIDDDRFDEAQQIIQNEIQHAVGTSESIKEAAPWTCPNCGKEVGAEFAICWNCGAEVPDEL